MNGRRVALIRLWDWWSAQQLPDEVKEAEARWRHAEGSYREFLRGHRAPGLEGDPVPPKFLAPEVMHQLETLDQEAELRRTEYEERCSESGITPRW